ncbi:hypothetical protein [Flagellimonas crocea]|uniref:hypothetical protein n=1 Tax=Flagellimonas crocea TaxID=3067311 RepID=UPI00296EFACB|nr:hypothetical protein [Muricauda sp. DH64]
MKRIWKILLSITVVVGIFIAFVYLSVSETEATFRTCKIIYPTEIGNINFREFDSVTVSANTIYQASGFKEFMQGEQYRDAWTQPVTVPIAYLDTLKGGLKIIEEGGGKQTHSLELEDGTGIRYALRSLSKDPSKLVPDVAKKLGLENIVVDGVSAQHPYAALVVSKLSQAANVLHTHPKLIFVPKQETLGELNEKYGNRLYFFEYESEGEVDWTGIKNVKELIDTDDLQELRMEKGSEITIDKKELIKARLFDILIGDWDRHAKQWGWAMVKKDNGFLAIPVPTDRDNAFFKQDGVLPTLITNDLTLPKVQEFEEKIDFLPGLVRPFDEYFLRTATLEQFREAAKYLKQKLTDEVIIDAFNAWPKEVDSLDGPEIRNKIIARRDHLVQYAEEFYRTLEQRPKEPIILSGSEDLELEGSLNNCFDCDI